MNRLRMLGGWLVSLVFIGMVTGCAMLERPVGDRPPIVAAGDTVVISASRALILANATYKTVGTAAALGIEQGMLTGETKARVKAISARIVTALAAGEKAVSTGDKAVQAAEAWKGLDELCGLHPFLTVACTQTQ